MDSLNNFFDFAEDDYQYLKEDYERGRVANYMASMAQNVCERYLKHIIDKYVFPENPNEEREKQDYLHKHNLNTLLRYINSKTDFQISKELCKTIKEADGYYYNTRYPGDESIQVNKEIIDDCMEAVKTCRDVVMYIKELEEKKEQEGQNEPEEISEEKKLIESIDESIKQPTKSGKNNEGQGNDEQELT